MKPRDIALAALNAWERNPGLPDKILEENISRSKGLSDRDRAFTVHLFQGVLRWQIRLDWIVHRCVRFPFHHIQPPILNILRLALYQILFLDRVPESAAVNEAVNQAKAIGNRKAVRFVNGLLREACRCQAARP